MEKKTKKIAAIIVIVIIMIATLSILTYLFFFYNEEKTYTKDDIIGEWYVGQYSMNVYWTEPDHLVWVFNEDNTYNVKYKIFPNSTEEHPWELKDNNLCIYNIWTNSLDCYSYKFYDNGGILVLLKDNNPYYKLVKSK